LKDTDVRAGRMDTGLIDRKLAMLADARVHAEAVSYGIRHLLDSSRMSRPDALPHDPWASRDAYQLGGVRSVDYPIRVSGHERTVTVTWEPGRDEPAVTLPAWDGLDASQPPASAVVRTDGPGRVLVLDDLVQVEISPVAHDVQDEHDGHAGDSVRAPINGKVARVFVKEGDSVAKGDRVAVVEAMKMEHVLHASRDGVIGRVAVKEGQQVNQGALIAALADA
jgi:3-methylcrotonyl-CoA carboxylase alpha subunit